MRRCQMVDRHYKYVNNSNLGQFVDKNFNKISVGCTFENEFYNLMLRIKKINTPCTFNSLFRNDIKMSVKTRRNTDLGTVVHKLQTDGVTSTEKNDDVKVQIKEENVDLDFESEAPNTNTTNTRTQSTFAEYETNENIKIEMKTEIPDVDFQIESPDIDRICTGEILTYYLTEPDDEFKQYFELEVDNVSPETEICNTDSTFAAGLPSSAETTDYEPITEENVEQITDVDGAQTDAFSSAAPQESANKTKRNAAPKKHNILAEKKEDFRRTRNLRTRTTPKIAKPEPGHVVQVDDFDAKKLALNLLSTGSLYRCPICKEKFTRRYNLMSHMQIHCAEKRQFRPNEDDQFPCSLCGKKFAAKDDLQLHYNTHLYKLQSKISAMREETESEMEDTVAYDSGELDSLLEVTPKIITKEPGNSPQSIVSPTKTKANETVAVYSCLICEKKFRQRNNLTSHMQIHSSEKHIQCPKENQFPCSMCNKRFSSRNSLQLHLKNHGSYVQFVLDALQQGIV